MVKFGGAFHIQATSLPGKDVLLCCSVQCVPLFLLCKSCCSGTRFVVDEHAALWTVRGAALQETEPFAVVLSKV